ncbi:MAG: YvcK family protein [Chloroflexi bacterium]|nr:YvcK family protein [Chloroflexota bacterium]
MHWRRRFNILRTWLIPGLHIKRWLLLAFVGIFFFSLGATYLLRQVYADTGAPGFVYWPTLGFLPLPWRAFVFGCLGLLLTLLGLFRLNRSLLAPFTHPNEDVITELYRHHRRRQGPRIVCLGGGTGMPSVLRGLKAYTDNITAIVTVADDGGSSGRLRSELGLLPPGDFRNNIAALSEAEATTARLFQYRFHAGAGLEGHAFGNLYLAAMAEISGSFEQGLIESSRVLAVRGRVLPSTLELVQLVAEVRDDEGRLQRIRGESLIPKLGNGRQIQRIYLDPEAPRAYPEAVRAILGADMIIAGPGSLYTSIMPNLLVPEIKQAVLAAPALKVYVCNIATQPGETTGYDVDDHVQALVHHAGRGLFQIVVANNAWSSTPPPGGKSDWVHLPDRPGRHYRLVTADLRHDEQPWRHDPARMGRALMDLLAEHRGQRINRIG